MSALLLSVGYPLSHVVKCWCDTFAARFSQVAQRHSHDFCRFFPPGCTFSVATTIACCLCHLVRVTSTFAVGIVVKFASRQLLHFFGVQLRTLVSFKRRCSPYRTALRPSNLSLVSRFPYSWSDTASFRSCLSLPPGFLDTREAGIREGSHACVTLLLLLDLCSGRLRATSRQAALKCGGFAITEKFQVFTVTRLFIMGTLGSARKSRRLVALC